MQLDTRLFSSGAWSAPFPPVDSSNTLVIAFGAPEFHADPAPLKELAAAYPQSVVVGCSTSGEIWGTEVHDESVSAAIVRFGSTGLKSAFADCGDASQSRQAGHRLAEALNGDGLRAVFVLAEGLSINGTELVAGLNEVLGDDVVVTGGLAGDGPRFEKTWVLDDGEVRPNGVVAVGLYGDALRIGHGSRGGWDRFGPERTITRSEGNVLFELDGRPALELYKEYLGDRAEGLPATGLLFPLSLRQGDEGDGLVRTILAVDEAAQSMTFAGDMPTGARAQLMKANFDRLVDGAQKAANAANANDNPVLCLAISCVGRRLVLGERAEDETEATFDTLPKGSTQVGFYSYGELSPMGVGRCELHNQTMTITTYSEVE